MKSCGRKNVKKNRDIQNGEQYIVLGISSKLDCLDKREVTSSEPKNYMGRKGKGMTNSLNISTKIPNKKQKSRLSINDITNQDFRNFLKGFTNSPYLVLK